MDLILELNLKWHRLVDQVWSGSNAGIRVSRSEGLALLTFRVASFSAAILREIRMRILPIAKTVYFVHNREIAHQKVCTSSMRWTQGCRWNISRPFQEQHIPRPSLICCALVNYSFGVWSENRLMPDDHSAHSREREERREGEKRERVQDKRRLEQRARVEPYTTTENFVNFRRRILWKVRSATVLWSFMYTSITAAPADSIFVKNLENGLCSENLSLCLWKRAQ